MFFWLVIPRGGELTLVKFMNPSYRWIVYFALAMLIFFACNELRRLFSSRTFSLRERRARSLTVITLSVPLLFFLVAKDAYLTTEIHDIEAVKTVPSAGSAVQAGPAPSEESGKNGNSFSFVDPGGGDVTILKIFQDTEIFLGQKVEIVGIAQDFPELGEDKFYLYRLLITCCAADAQPLGLIVRSESLLQVEPNQWYRAEGVVTMMPVEGEGDHEFLGMDAKSITKSEEPDFPFMF
jgi:putative membrane protein